MAHMDCPSKTYASKGNGKRARRSLWDREFDLWFVQIILSQFFGMTGAMKTFLSPAALVPMGFVDAIQIPYLLLRLTGWFELVGALLILVPPLSRAIAFIAPTAAAGLATLQLLTIGLQAARGSVAFGWALNLILLALLLFVVWGRAIQASPRPTQY
jgi:DoxX-like family